jgi:hypothetical protein
VASACGRKEKVGAFFLMLEHVEQSESVARTNASSACPESNMQRCTIPLLLHHLLQLGDSFLKPRQFVRGRQQQPFRRRRPDHFEQNAAISRHFERDPIPYALETDWPVGAAGFEPVH